REPLMRMRRSFRPSLDEVRLEERVVLSHVGAAQIVTAAAVPVTTWKTVTAVYTNLHNSVYVPLATAEVRQARLLDAQVVRGTIPFAQAQAQLPQFTTTLITQLLPRAQAICGQLPYGAGRTPRPSGLPSLFAAIQAQLQGLQDQINNTIIPNATSMTAAATQI